MIAARKPRAGEALLRVLVGLGPLLALLLLALTQGAVFASAGDTLGYDFEAYRRAGERVLAGRQLYDTGAAAAGPFALFLYPPPFALAMVPFALPGAEVARVAWLALMLAAFLAGTAILPVRPGVRWGLVALAALCFPFLYAMKLGQVSPLLYLFFAVAWRALEQPLPTGMAVAAGMLTKLQPALLFGWLAFGRQGRAIVAGLATLAGAVLVATLVVGIGAWHDYIELLGRVSDPFAAEKNMSFAAIAHRSGASAGIAGAIGVATLVGVAILAVFAWIRRDAATGLLVGVAASQLASPLYWDHYALFVLLPVALLLQRRQWWAIALPLLPWLGIGILYPGVLLIAAIGLVVARGREADVPVIHAWPGTPGW